MRRTSGRRPFALGSEDEGDAAGEVGLPHRRSRLAHRACDPEIAALDLREVAGEVRHDGDREVLDGAGRGTADGGGDARRAVRGHDDAARAGSLGAADHGAEVARVADLVEAGEERRRARGELERVGVAERLAPGDDALMVARAGRLGEVALELRLHARPLDVAQPGLAAHRALARPQLEHLARAAQRLAHGPAPVDELARHERGTSRKPAGDVAHLPARGLDLVAQAVGLREVLGVARLAPPLGELDELRRRLLGLGERLETEDLERAPQQLVVAPAVHHRQRLRRVEVVVERRLERRPVPHRLARRAEDVAEGLRAARPPARASRRRSRAASASGPVRRRAVAPRGPSVSSDARGSRRRCRATWTSSPPSSVEHPVVHPDPRELVARAHATARARSRGAGRRGRAHRRGSRRRGPNASSAIAEHSMCQPGRPAPQGESHAVSSPGLFAFQSAKSRGSALSGFGSCSSTWSSLLPRQPSVARVGRDAEVDVAVRPRTQSRSRRAAR